MDMEVQKISDARAVLEEAVLKQHGLLWAVLAGWRDSLQLRRVTLPDETDHLLENARIRIASGCFSVPRHLQRVCRIQ
jgi:hypothetical protein